VKQLTGAEVMAHLSTLHGFPPIKRNEEVLAMYAAGYREYKQPARSLKVFSSSLSADGFEYLVMLRCVSRYGVGEVDGTYLSVQLNTEDPKVGGFLIDKKITIPENTKDLEEAFNLTLHQIEEIVKTLHTF
jgi:hypothetical protein